MKKTVLLIIGIAINLFIWLNSLMPASISSEQSGFIVNIIYPIFKNIIDINLFETIIRKLAHFMQFMFLSIVFVNYYRKTKTNKPFIITTIHIMLVAIIDETIQLFVPGRAGLITDVLIDVSGGLVGLIIVWLSLKVIKQ